MYSYLMLKHAHAGFAYLTLLSFAIRAGLMLAGSPLLQSKLARILPHIIDTLLLACAVALVILGGWPLSSPWIVAKIVALLGYIALGTIALKRGRTLQIRQAALIASFALLAYIFAVAKTKMIAPFLF
ncbi:SirB2 family protein [Craterilacuibacter sinensis]|uniref:Invasion protein n=1 Tax=Craterilacuibacter sinensis TaxID=2686017 RepID=A0A845BU84_9NEIS|nr:SirB2 family protein [Craterilacuibacter sinensis]MXR37726.1 invasion protein [Craterilacuibacter sinensis]